MGKKWQLIQHNEEARQLIVGLCAQGYHSKDIAGQMKDSGLIEQCTEEDVEHWRKTNTAAIANFARKNADDIVRRCVRAERPFRIAELDKLCGHFARVIPQLVDESPLHAAKVGEAYLKLVNQLAVETGQLQQKGTSNTLIAVFQNANPEEKKRLIEQYSALHESIRKLGPVGNQEKIIEGDFTEMKE
jgi:hypothetical protein